MANKVTIEVEALLVDQVSGKTKYVISGLDGIEKAANDAQKGLDKLNKKKVHPIIDADNDKFLKKMRESENKIARIAGKTATVTLKVLDKGTNIVNKLEGGLKKVVGKTWTTMVKIKDYATAPLRKLKDTLFSIKGLVMTITAGLAAKQFVLNPIGLADAYSSTKIGFSTLLGDEQGQAMMNAMDDFAKKTPFKTSGVISNAQKMMAYGWDPERILEDMEVIGDAAAATGKMDEGLESIVYALSEIRSKGKLSTQELNQLAGAGIKAKAYLAEGLGYGTSDAGMKKLAEDLEDGAIGANQAIELILEGMKEFEGMMDRTANETVEGLKSQIADTFEINIFRRWGQGLQDGAKRGMGSIVELLDSAQDGLANFGDMLYEIGEKASNWVADKLEVAVEKITTLTQTDEFKNAGLGGKIKILWDGVVANPIREWWEGGGRDKAVAYSGKVGAWLGKTITDGLLAVFGMADILDDDKAKELGESGGMSIAQSFARGFKENFDGHAITDAIVDAISNVWNALPTWAKFLLFNYGSAKIMGGISSLIGGVSSFVGSRGTYVNGGVTGASGLLGAIGRTGVAGVGGSGILGTFANTGYRVLGGTSALSVGGGTAALVGGTTIAGLGAGIATAGSGMYDLYNGYQNNDATAKKSGWWKLGGAGGGAAAGAAIGSIIPGVGTLLGAGVGALAGSALGWWQSSKAKKMAAEAAESSDSLEELAKSESAAAEEAAKLLIQNEKLAKESLAEHFGDVTLSAEEMQQAIRNVVGESFYKETEAATAAIDAMNTSFAAVESQSASLKKNLWMASLKKDAKLTEEEVNTLKSSVESFSNATKTYVTDAQYAATESITAIMGNSDKAKKLIESTNDYYGKQSDELASLSKQLNDELNKALSKDSEGGAVITVNEKESLDKIRSQMAEIARKLQEEEYEAEMNILKAKYAGDMTAEGFGELIAGAAEQNKTLAESYWDGFGRASIGKSAEEIEILRQGVLDKLSNLWSNTGDLGINTLREQYSEELGILGQDIGTMLEKNTPDQIMKAAEGMDDKTRQGIGKLMESMEPTTAEVEKLVKSYEDAGKKVPEALTSYLESAEFYEALSKGPKAIEEYFAQPVDVVMGVDITGEKNIQNSIDVVANDFGVPDEHAATVAMLLYGDKNILNQIDVSQLAKEFGIPDSQAKTIVEKLTGEKSIENRLSVLASDFGIPDVINKTVQVRVHGSVTTAGNPKMDYAAKQAQLYNLPRYRGGIVGGSSALESFARGGMVRGGSKLIEVAEEGTPEMIIPLGAQRRDRALKLWEKAGQMLNVPGFARGGMTNGNRDEGIRFHGYGSSENAGGQTVQVDIGGITFEIHVNGTDAQSIAEAIKAQVADIAEDVAGIMADAFAAQFENTPVRGGAA